MINQLIGPKGIILFSLIIVIMWFRQGLILAGAEEQLSFYNFTKSLDLFSYPWYQVATGMPTLLSLPRVPYFMVFEYLYRIGFSPVFLQALTFFIIILTGLLSVYYLIKVTLEDVLKEQWKNLAPFLGALFYFLNPFAMTQIWGRVLSYQFFVFALVPSFLLFFVLSIKKRNLIFCLLGSLVSIIFSGAYLSPAAVVTSWSAVGIYLLFYIFISRHSLKKILFALSSFSLLFFLWVLVNFFWIYPLIKHGNQLLTESLTLSDNISSLKALSPNSRIYNVIRLIHREYYDGTYGWFSNNFLITFLSWFLPFLLLLSIPTFKKIRHFGFYLVFLLISIFITTGANFPTGWLLIWLFEKIPLLQALRNPYEKFGVNLMLAYAPFFAIGLLVLGEKLTNLFKNQRLVFINIFILVFLLCGILVWPMWRGNFAGGAKTNFWIKVPDYYKQANDWLNSQGGDFNILHLPLLSEDGVTYTWEHPYEGIEPSEFIFDKKSIARNFSFNKDYYSALIERFGITIPFSNLPNFSNDNLDFKDENLLKELSKLNVRFIILHHDTNYEKRRAMPPKETREYLELQEGIKKVQSFGLLDIYKVDLPDNIDLIYSPNLKVSYQKINTTNYLVDVTEAKGETELYFLQQFHPSWQAFLNGEKIENHSKVFSYANKWTINKTGNYQVIIKFVQQDSVIFGKWISSVSTFLLGISILIYLLKRRKPFN